MRLLYVGLAAIFCAPSLCAQDKPLHGIDVTDINRKAKPCEDFYEFANGNWRANSPIPPSMVIWSKRWASGESTKDVLHSILEEAAAHSSSAAKIHGPLDWRLLRLVHGRKANRRPGGEGAQAGT
jgi:hypothetical protein